MTTTSSRLAQADYSSLGGGPQPTEDYKPVRPISVTKNANPDWKYGQGATDNGSSLTKKHIEIDPYAPGRPMFHNYTLLISGIVPRPIGLTSTLSKDGKPNLAPFSYFQVVDHDPPVFVIGFSGRASGPKDTLKNLEETGECVLNVVSEHMMEAVNATSLDAPPGTSEWAISGLYKAPSSTVKPARVQESIFSIEGRLIQTVDYKTSRPSSGAHGKLAIIEGTRFWAREDAIDADGKHLDIDVLRPLGQLGDISYSRITDTFKLARSSWKAATKEHGETLKELARDGEGDKDEDKDS
ncbi:hypothetical protein M409DRAFT_66616 [Zasmidium cellare ATCC 36951]|uniref:Flavin reductase like domain-containing protein n=1 Tax=Zasmidium cellare ATCC 36951 TaxID=1080233 RepID=A0A6A6CK86_ZASCE|nr:uncharacterized protein M409DRAFT_66616 [Zasmidium cellare ATCC 36951]KAF2166618.1 hypothetical protein M409DRAFT_66616 [Zasmidium cellare ATCC 36951]